MLVCPGGLGCFPSGPSSFFLLCSVLCRARTPCPVFSNHTSPLASRAIPVESSARSTSDGPLPGRHTPSVLEMTSMATPVPVVDWEALGKRRPLANGSFCLVESCLLHNESIAVKHPRSDLAGDSRVGVRDLLREIDYLVNTMAPYEHIVRALGHGTMANDYPFLLLPLMAGTVATDLPGDRYSTSFWSRRAGVKRWPLHRACRLAAELASALDHCHHNAVPFTRVLHRDVKPANCGLNASDHLILFDFGLATLWHVGEGDAGGTERRCLTACTGSLRTMPPEVMRSESYNHKCDVYSWAMVSWQMIAHDAPFVSDCIRTDRPTYAGCREQRTSPDQPATRNPVSWPTN